MFFDSVSKFLLLSYREDTAYFCSTALKLDFKNLDYLTSDYKTLLEEYGFITGMRCIIIDSSLFCGAEDVRRFFIRNITSTENTARIIGVCSSEVCSEVRMELQRMHIEVIRIPCEFNFFRNRVKSAAGKKYSNICIPAVGTFGSLDKFVGKSESVIDVRRKVSEAAESDCTVIFEGETGTGKSFLAGILHEISERASKKLVRINSGDLKEGLAMSDLYGTITGAYTGAVSKSGHFTVADGGMIFFDEIGNMHRSVQESLLTVLDTGRFYKVGSVVEQTVDVRFLSATNADIGWMLRKGLFRKDLFNRISDCVIKLPALRERPEDVPDILNYFLHKNKCEDIVFSDEAVDFLMNFYWPGNTRDLIRCAKFLAGRFRGKTVSADELAEWTEYHCF